MKRIRGADPPPHSGYYRGQGIVHLAFRPLLMLPLGTIGRGGRVRAAGEVRAVGAAHVRTDEARPYSRLVPGEGATRCRQATMEQGLREG